MKKALLATAVTMAMTSSAQAEIRINGFANFIGGITSSDDSLYGYDDNISFSEESLFALQASGDINDKMTATIQLLARGIDDYDIDAEWAYITYQATSNTSITAGRFRLPLFRYSASLDVGYSFHWVNAPRSMYDVPFNNLDGIRIDYSDYVGDWEYNLQASFGNYNNDIEAGEIEGDNVYAFSAEAVYDWFRIRSPALDAALAPIGGASSELADFLAFEDDTGTFVGVGLEVDKFDWFVAAEYTVIEVEDSYLPDDTAYYITGGLRTGKWTPSFTYENFDSDEPAKGLDILNQLPDAVQDQLRPGVIGLQRAQAESYEVYTATIRYDYDTNVAFKADISRFDDDINDDNDSTLVRFAVNYVF
jgi:hypothetical protein